jgi:hypothetical protein
MRKFTGIGLKSWGSVESISENVCQISLNYLSLYLSLYYYLELNVSTIKEIKEKQEI